MKLTGFPTIEIYSFTWKVYNYYWRDPFFHWTMIMGWRVLNIQIENGAHHQLTWCSLSHNIYISSFPFCCFGIERNPSMAEILHLIPTYAPISPSPTNQLPNQQTNKAYRNRVPGVWRSHRRFSTMHGNTHRDSELSRWPVDPGYLLQKEGHDIQPMGIVS